jgi:hypothetical protein
MSDENEQIIAQLNPSLFRKIFGGIFLTIGLIILPVSILGIGIIFPLFFLLIGIGGFTSTLFLKNSKDEIISRRKRLGLLSKRTTIGPISDFQEISIIVTHHRHGSSYTLYLKKKVGSHIALNARGDFISIKELAEKISKVINLPVKQEG